MRVVRHRIDALGTALADVVLVRLGRRDVRRRRVGVAAHPLVDVRGHVDHVAGAGHQRAQPVRRGLRALGALRRFHGVDVEVVRSRMVLVAGQHLLEGGHDLVRPGVGPAVPRPVVPGAKVHERFRVHGLGVEVGGVLPGQVPHRVRVGLVRGRAVLLPAGVAARHRVDVGALPRRGFRLHGHGLLGQLVRLRLVVGRHGHVDVRSQHDGLAPVAHGAIRIEARGLAEGAARLRVVEPVGEVHTLVDEELRLFRLRRHREGVDAEVLEPGRQLASGRGLLRLLRLLVVFVDGCLGVGCRRSGQDAEGGADHVSPPEGSPF